MRDIKKNLVLGVGINSLTESEVLEYIYTGLKNETRKYYIVTPNPELLVMASRSKEYKDVLNSAKLALPDGFGVMVAGYLMGKPFKQRITGADFMETLCKETSKQPITVGFLGGGPNVAELTAECLKRKYPSLRVNMVSQEWNESLKDNEVDILFVAFGSPKQEIWLSKNINRLPVKVAMGVGGSFDFVSGNVPRAPLLLRKAGLEWLFRLIVQPWRIKRQLSILVFIFLIIKEKFSYKY